MTDTLSSAGPAGRAVADVVRETQGYYDGPADDFYRAIWGENVHIGLFERPDEDLVTAMARSNERISENVGLEPGHRVLDVGCGYGGLARFLARRFGCHVWATNISNRELDWGRDLTKEAGLGDLVRHEWADFHSLPYPDESFDYYWSQEAFLHAADKAAVLREAHRVLVPGGRLVFTDLLVRRGTSGADRERIYDRVKSPDMWDAADYREALAALGFRLEQEADWSENVALTYSQVRAALAAQQATFTARLGADYVERTLAALAFWVESAQAGKIGWGYFVASR